MRLPLRLCPSSGANLSCHALLGTNHEIYHALQGTSVQKAFFKYAPGSADHKYDFSDMLREDVIFTQHVNHESTVRQV